MQIYICGIHVNVYHCSATLGVFNFDVRYCFYFLKGLGTKESDEINMFHVKLFQIFIIPQRLLNTCEIVKV